MFLGFIIRFRFNALLPEHYLDINRLRSAFQGEIETNKKSDFRHFLSYINRHGRFLLETENFSIYEPELLE